MLDIRLLLAAVWVMLMLVYLLGDVLRIFAGDFIPGEIGGVKVTQLMWMGIAVLMLMPILMIFLTLTLEQSLSRWANIIVAVFFFIFNLVGLSGYKPYDKFLIIVGLIFNLITVWYAWHWV